jgi:hypothetical protein
VLAGGRQHKKRAAPSEQLTVAAESSGHGRAANQTLAAHLRPAERLQASGVRLSPPPPISTTRATLSFPCATRGSRARSGVAGGWGNERKGWPPRSPGTLRPLIVVALLLRMMLKFSNTIVPNRLRRPVHPLSCGGKGFESQIDTDLSNERRLEVLPLPDRM